MIMLQKMGLKASTEIVGLVTVGEHEKIGFCRPIDQKYEMRSFLTVQANIPQVAGDLSP